MLPLVLSKLPLRTINNEHVRLRRWTFEALPPRRNLHFVRLRAEPNTKPEHKPLGRAFNLPKPMFWTWYLYAGHDRWILYVRCRLHATRLFGLVAFK